MENIMNFSKTDIAVAVITAGAFAAKSGLLPGRFGSGAIIQPPKRQAPAKGQKVKTQQRALTPANLQFSMSKFQKKAAQKKTI